MSQRSDLHSSRILLALLFLIITGGVVAAKDYVIVPSDAASTDVLGSLLEGTVISIDGKKFNLMESDALTRRTQRILDKFVVSRIDVKELSLAEIVSFFEKRIKETRQEGELAANYFSIEYPRKVGERRFTLEYNNTSLKTILEKLAREVNCSVRVKVSRIVLEYND